jgi:hypothetical protein
MVQKYGTDWAGSGQIQLANSYEYGVKPTQSSGVTSGELEFFLSRLIVGQYFIIFVAAKISRLTW